MEDPLFLPGLPGKFNSSNIIEIYDLDQDQNESPPLIQLEQKHKPDEIPVVQRNSLPNSAMRDESKTSEDLQTSIWREQPKAPSKGLATLFTGFLSASRSGSQPDQNSDPAEAPFTGVACDCRRQPDKFQSKMERAYKDKIGKLRESMDGLERLIGELQERNTRLQRRNESLMGNYEVLKRENGDLKQELREQAIEFRNKTKENSEGFNREIKRLKYENGELSTKVFGMVGRHEFASHDQMHELMETWHSSSLDYCANVFDYPNTRHLAQMRAQPKVEMFNLLINYGPSIFFNLARAEVWKSIRRHVQDSFLVGLGEAMSYETLDAELKSLEKHLPRTDDMCHGNVPSYNKWRSDTARVLLFHLLRIDPQMLADCSSDSSFRETLRRRSKELSKAVGDISAAVQDDIKRGPLGTFTKGGAPGSTVTLEKIITLAIVLVLNLKTSRTHYVFMSPSIGQPFADWMEPVGDLRDITKPSNSQTTVLFTVAGSLARYAEDGNLCWVSKAKVFLTPKKSFGSNYWEQPSEGEAEAQPRGGNSQPEPNYEDSKPEQDHKYQTNNLTSNGTKHAKSTNLLMVTRTEDTTVSGLPHGLSNMTPQHGTNFGGVENPPNTENLAMPGALLPPTEVSPKPDTHVVDEAQVNTVTEDTKGDSSGDAKTEPTATTSASSSIQPDAEHIPFPESSQVSLVVVSRQLGTDAVEETKPGLVTENKNEDFETDGAGESMPVVVAENRSEDSSGKDNLTPTSTVSSPQANTENILVPSASQSSSNGAPSEQTSNIISDETTNPGEVTSTDEEIQKGGGEAEKFGVS